MPQKIRTRYEWLDDLATASPAVAALNLKAKLRDETYKAAGLLAANPDAFNFANCADHTALLADAAEHLASSACRPADLEKWFTDLTSANTYGSACELGAYALLAKAGLPFTAQIPLTGTQILNPNGSDLDGRFDFAQDVYFDIKAFGFHDRLLAQLQKRLESHFPQDDIAIEGGIHVSIAMMQRLLGPDFSALEHELRTHKRATRLPLTFRIHEKRRIRLATRSLNFIALAKENAGYPFNYAKQFTRAAPFLLIFVLHPWIGGPTLTTNFARGTDRFMRIFATAVFNNASSKTAPKTHTRICHAAPLLSGMLFLNSWAGSPLRHQCGHYLLLNPAARFPLPETAILDLQHAFGARLTTM